MTQPPPPVYQGGQQPSRYPPAPPAGQVALSSEPRLIAETRDGPGMLVRGLWFVFVGWWLTGFVTAFAWVAMVTIIGLPLGIWLVNRVPTALTLRPRTSHVYAWKDEAGYTRTVQVKIDQPDWYWRGLWFVVVGWWASAFVMVIGYFLIVLILTIPMGLWLFNRVPFVASLYRY